MSFLTAELPNLDTLPQIGGDHVLSAQSKNTENTSSSISGLDVGKIAMSTAFPVIGGLISSSKSGGKSSFPSLQSITVIILGLLIIAAGIFSFREVRQTVISVGKKAATTAAV